ncbi:hypothetical protein GUJ93_ZPchr0006g43335 [Zizania palustris]|uniref:Uncharacterized protein n=1 Tax=Zizania palustris TaxID=103762 RepID=A0A8J5T0J3_ZIZPA|nr:hypothetical protein GUJ93_ZPchr0006g43335 [Zizania palustris]
MSFSPFALGLVVRGSFAALSSENILKIPNVMILTGGGSVTNRTKTEERSLVSKVRGSFVPPSFVDFQPLVKRNIQVRPSIFQ